MFCIAGIRFRIRAHSGTPLEIIDPVYNKFLIGKVLSDLDEADVEVTVSFGTAPALDSIEPLWDDGQACTIFSFENALFYRIQMRGTEEPFLTACFGPGLKKVEIFCSGNVKTQNGQVAMPFTYPCDQHFLIHYLSSRKGAIIHSAGFSIAERGFIFPGVSGAGKSTITRILLENDRIKGLSDDRIIVKKIDDCFVMFGTPWAGDARIAENESAPLRAVFFLVQSAENRIESIPPGEAFRRLMPVSSILWYDRKNVDRMFTFFEELVIKTPAYAFHFTPDRRAADCLMEFVNGK